MRADRLVATLLLMQARGRVTAAELAAELETSVATARRDLEALSAAGIPVYPQPGRGGGWQLLGGGRTDLSGLTSAEARALFVLVGPAASVDAEAKAALRKLVRALPETFRADAEAAAEAVVIDTARWGRPQREKPAMVDTLQDAVVRRLRVRITYTGWQREPVERVVDPWGLVDKNDTWYLLAGVDGQARTYRVDRIAEALVTAEAANRPEDFSLADAWDDVVSEVREQRNHATATLLADEAIVPFLRELFGESVSDAPAVDQRVTVTISAQTEVLLARRLAGWAEHFTVLEPPSLRAELARLGASLVERNG